jgi:hypothetical protein
MALPRRAQDASNAEGWLDSARIPTDSLFVTVEGSPPG